MNSPSLQSWQDVLDHKDNPQAIAHARFGGQLPLFIVEPDRAPTPNFRVGAVAHGFKFAAAYAYRRRLPLSFPLVAAFAFALFVDSEDEIFFETDAFSIVDPALAGEYSTSFPEIQALIQALLVHGPQFTLHWEEN